MLISQKLSLVRFNGVMFNQGQVCCAGSRVFIQKKHYDNVVADMASHAKNIKQGAGLDPTTKLDRLFLKNSKNVFLVTLPKELQKVLKSLLEEPLQVKMAILYHQPFLLTLMTA